MLYDVTSRYVKAHFLPLENDSADTKFSDCYIDGARLTADTEEQVAQLLCNGYEIVSVTPVLSGSWTKGVKRETGYGYGYSFTDGMSIIAKKAI